MRDPYLYLDDILESVVRIQSYVKGMSSEAFSEDFKTQDAVVRNLEIIGEASGKLPEDFIARTPEIEWRKIRALRNILVHEYFGIDDAIVWDVVQNKLGELETACRKLIQAGTK